MRAPLPVIVALAAVSLACRGGARSTLEPVPRASLCVTQGHVLPAVDGGGVRVDEGAMRAVIAGDRSRSAELAFRYDWDWGLAERELRRGIALNPTSPEAYSLLARFLRSMGRFDEARRALDRSLALTGRQVTDMLSYARIAYFQRDFARSERELRGGDRSLRAWRAWYADAVAGMGRLAEADSILALPSGDMDDADLRFRRAILLARVGRVAEARAQLRAAGDRARDYPTVAAGALVALGDTAAAIAEIERAVAEHDPLVVDLAVEPRLDPLRANPRFKRIMTDLRFPSIR